MSGETRMEAQAKQLEFQKLVEELTKKKPNQSRIRELTSKLGLPYRKDPIEQLDFVIKSAHGFFFDSEKDTPDSKG
jgi:hypothetical protein